MADWLNRLNIGDLHEQFKKDELTPEALGKAVMARVRKLLEGIKFPTSWNKWDRADCKDDLEDLHDQFEIVGDIEDYDGVLSDLYDIADRDHLIWVDTAQVA